MGMLRIGICDDIYDARLVLRAALERVLEKRRVQGQFREFSSGEGLLRWLESHAGELDLVFLDMEMGELDGMETARRLRAADAGLQLVFVAGYAEHVFDGYSVGALGYLLKPPKAEQLEEVLDRAQAALVRDLDRAYICRSGDTHYRIPIANILYFVSDRRQVACVTAGREYTFYGKLDTVAAEVGADFVRIHQRYLVRTGAVDGMEGGEVVIQTSEPGHPVIRQVVAGDFAGMARMQLSEREAFFYPPYARLTSLTLRHRDVALLRRGVTELAARLRVRFGRRVLGPMTPPVDRIRGEYLAGLLLKIESGASSAKARSLLGAELKAFAENPEFKTITVVCNVDPQ